MRKDALIYTLATLALAGHLAAVPPLLSGDVPTAEKETFEIYSGLIYESADHVIERQFPLIELVYGLSDRHEITFEIPNLSLQGAHGFGDVVLGTKYMFLKETKTLPGISGTFELKLPTASTSRGLGGGAYDFDLRIPFEKMWGWFTARGNVGCTFLGTPRFNDGSVRRDRVWFASYSQGYQVTRKTKLLSEVYLETGEESGQPNRFAANVGFEQELTHDLIFQAAVARSLREDQRGGPDVRVYVGLHWTFDAPWKSHAQ
jgi:hypothetical protein